LIFVSGKIVITGAKKELDLSTALTKLYPVLLEFKKVQTTAAPDALGPLPIATDSALAPTTEKRMEEV
jgi:transcription initiation factor TFIID TATA-box-binding protein